MPRSTGEGRSVVGAPGPRGGGPRLVDVATRLLHEASVARLRYEARRAGAGASSGARLVATACHRFPIYSQTFVYQELAALIRGGFDLRFLYSELGSRDDLPARFEELWRRRRRSFLPSGARLSDLRRYRRRMPERVESLTRLLCEASGLSRGELEAHSHFAQAFSFARLAEALRTDYLHSYFFYERSFFCFVVSYLLGIPRGVSCYADHLLEDYELKLVALQLEHCDVVVATSARIKAELLEICPLADPERILVKPNAIDSCHFPVAGVESSASARPARITCVSRLEPKKGLLYLVEAVGLLRDEGHDVELHFVGEADTGSSSSREYRRRLEARCAELGLGDAVVFEGRLPQSAIVPLLHRSDLFVAPFVELDSGDKDGIPTALLEAMATGRAVVATDAGSIPEVIDDGRDGLLVEQRHPQALAGAIRTLLRDPERRARLGAAAADKVRRRFDVSVCERRLHGAIRAVLAEGERRQGTADPR